MGCDIHVVLEQKSIEGEWYGVREFGALPVRLFGEDVNERPKSNYVWFKIQSRNYQLFGDLADVRSDGAFGHTPRGLPPDMSAMVKDRYDGDDDLHSHSWLAPSELEPILVKHFGAGLVAARLTATHSSYRDSHPLRCFGEFIEPEVFNIDEGDTEAIFAKADATYRLVFCFDN